MLCALNRVTRKTGTRVHGRRTKRTREQEVYASHRTKKDEEPTRLWTENNVQQCGTGRRGVARESSSTVVVLHLTHEKTVRIARRREYGDATCMRGLPRRPETKMGGGDRAADGHRGIWLGRMRTEQDEGSSGCKTLARSVCPGKDASSAKKNVQTPEEQNADPLRVFSLGGIEYAKEGKEALAPERVVSDALSGSREKGGPDEVEGTSVRQESAVQSLVRRGRETDQTGASPGRDECELQRRRQQSGGKRQPAVVKNDRARAHKNANVVGIELLPGEKRLLNDSLKPANAALAGDDGRAPRDGGVDVYVEIGQPSLENDAVESDLSHTRVANEGPQPRRLSPVHSVPARDKDGRMRAPIKITAGRTTGTRAATRRANSGTTSLTWRGQPHRCELHMDEGAISGHQSKDEAPVCDGNGETRDEYEAATVRTSSATTLQAHRKWSRRRELLVYEAAVAHERTRRPRGCTTISAEASAKASQANGVRGTKRGSCERQEAKTEDGIRMRNVRTAVGLDSGMASLACETVTKRCVRAHGNVRLRREECFARRDDEPNGNTSINEADYLRATAPKGTRTKDYVAHQREEWLRARNQRNDIAEVVEGAIVARRVRSEGGYGARKQRDNIVGVDDSWTDASCLWTEDGTAHERDAPRKGRGHGAHGKRNDIAGRDSRMRLTSKGAQPHKRCAKNETKVKTMDEGPASCGLRDEYGSGHRARKQRNDIADVDEAAVRARAAYGRKRQRVRDKKRRGT
ncbi:hypothetical protein B0H11DRAFT_2193846 [Mycena galericulata]|nr:hypothetical protein B0H11DRAFT_2193846 [Mycena galericulata]